MKILLISNSTNPGETFLSHALGEIEQTLSGVKKVLFIPYAAVSFSFDEYEARMQNLMGSMGIEVESSHRYRNVKKAAQEAEAIMVGGGNTFRLAKMIQIHDIIEAVRYKILSGTPYVGWSAGANVACPTICTTNDMPIVEPDNFSAFNLIRFQINPHYTEKTIEGIGCESRDQRIDEFLIMDPYAYVVGLREGSMIRINNGDIELLGSHSAKIFKHGVAPYEVKPGEDIDFLFE